MKLRTRTAEPVPGRVPPKAAPAFYALGGGGWRDYVTLLHPPYTLWHLSYVVLGAALSPTVRYDRLAATLLAFFLALGVAAHALDELAGRPLRTRIPSSILVTLAIGGLSGATASGLPAPSSCRRGCWRSSASACSSRPLQSGVISRRVSLGHLVRGRLGHLSVRHRVLRQRGGVRAVSALRFRLRVRPQPCPADPQPPRSRLATRGPQHRGATALRQRHERRRRSRLGARPRRGGADADVAGDACAGRIRPAHARLDVRDACSPTAWLTKIPAAG